MSIEARLAKLESREAIRNLCSRYSLAVDDHDFTSLTALFARDARYGWVSDADPTVGRDAIGALLESRIAPAGPSFHVNHDMLVDWDDSDPERATGIVFCHAEVSPAGRHLVGAIRYHDVYVREEGRWLFAERRLAFLYFTPVGQYPGVLESRERLRFLEPHQHGHWPDFA
jgi:hypothetical protein